MHAALMPALARLGVAAAMTAGPPELRERLRLMEAGELGDTDMLVLLAEVEAMTVLLAPPAEGPAAPGGGGARGGGTGDAVAAAAPARRLT